MFFSKLSFFILLSSWSTVVVARASVHKLIRDLIRSNSPLLQYPTQFTQDLVPKQIHSHNDCACLSPPRLFDTKLTRKLDWRDVPLLTALSYGVASVEADVWLSDGNLLVSVMPLPVF